MWVKITRARPIDEAMSTAPSRASAADRGASLVEILVSVVLVGLGAVGTLGAMSASVRGSSQHRDLTNAQAWLQGAADHLQGQQRLDCDNLGGVAGEAEKRIRLAYQAHVQSVSNPDGWPQGNIVVLAPVLFWDGDQYQTTCFDDKDINLQLITLQVTSASGKYIRSLQVVKGA
jgi:type II secretory pathway pseudopilin PulG